MKVLHKKILPLFPIILSLCVFLSILSISIYTQETLSEPLELEKKAQELSKKWSGDAYRHSAKLFLEAAEIWINRNNFLNAINCLQEAARLNFLLADYQSSKINIQTSIVLAKKINHQEGEATSLSLLSLILLEEGDIKQSEISYKKALELLANSNDRLAQAKALFSNAQFSYFQNNIEQTVKLFQDSLNYVNQTSDLRTTAQILHELAYAYFKQGNPILGLQTAEKSLAIWKDLGDERGEAITYISIGLAYKILGEERNALNAYNYAESKFPADTDLIEHARLLTGLAALYDKYGENQLVEKNLQRSYELFVQANYPQGQLAVLPTLIKISHQNKKPELISSYYAEVLRLSDKLKNDFYVGFTNEILGNQKLESNSLDEAIQLYNSALKILEKYKNKQGISLLNQRLGETFERKNQFETAKNHFNISLEFNRQIRDSFGEAQLLYNLANLFSKENNIEMALKTIEDSLKVTESLYSEVVNAKLKSTYFSNVYDRYELYINLLMKMHQRFPDSGYNIKALNTVEKSRSRSLLETLRLTEAKFTKDANPEDIKRENEILNSLNLKSDKLIELLSRDSDKAEINKVEIEIRQLENQLEELKAILKQNSPIYSAIKNPIPFNINEFQQNTLDQQTLLLEFSLGEKESYLWLISKNEISTYLLPSRQVIENRIEKIHHTFDSRQILPNEEIEIYQKRIAELEKTFQAEAKILSNELLGQIAEKLTNNRLIIVPDGKLALLPISALPSPNSDQPLIKTNEIIYEPSASLLTILPNIQNRKYQPSNDLFVLADPIFSETDIRLRAKLEKENSTQAVLGLNLRDFRLMDSNGKIPRLFASQEEAVSIAKAVGNSRTLIASGFEANRERVLKSDISNYRILHFATHGLVDLERPEVSSIILSQFDENGNKKEGFLRLQDIYSMDLASDLVVLSACQSGIGKEIKGDGLLSINNAFLRAGAKTVLSSAWKVDDNATADLMKNFYLNLKQKNLTPSEALREAQLSMLNSSQFKSPFYWAAFTVQGEFRQPIQFSPSYYYHFVFICLAILIAIVFLWRLRLIKIYKTTK